MSLPIRIPVVLTPEQHEILSRAAAALGLPLSAFLRMAALDMATRRGAEA